MTSRDILIYELCFPGTLSEVRLKVLRDVIEINRSLIGLSKEGIYVFIPRRLL